MRGILLDTDAVICLHGLKLLEPILAGFAAIRRQVVVTGYVARIELVSLQTHVARFQKLGWIAVEHVLKDTAAFAHFRALTKQPRVHKGEAEAIGWAMVADPRPLFVTRDEEAANAALRNGVPTTDVMGIVVEACETAELSRILAAQMLEVWNDPSQQRCRPHPYKGFEAAYGERLSQREAWR